MGCVWKLMGERLWDAVVAVNCLHASAIGLPTSCSPEHQLPKSIGPGFTQANIHTFSALFHFWPKKVSHLALVWPCFHTVSNVNMLPSEPCIHVSMRRSCKVRHRWHICRFSSRAAGVQVGSFIHCIMVLWIHYPFKGRVNPPSIWHAAHLAERHSDWVEGGGADGELWW